MSGGVWERGWPGSWMPFEASPTAGRRIMRKAKDNSPIRGRNPASGMTRQDRERGWKRRKGVEVGGDGGGEEEYTGAWSKKLLFKNVFTVWLARIAIRLESSVFTPLSVCAPLAVLSGDVETAGGARGLAATPVVIRGCVCANIGEGARARPKEPASPFPGLHRGLSNLFGYSPRRRGRKLQPLWNSTTLAVHSIVVDSTVASN